MKFFSSGLALLGASSVAYGASLECGSFSATTSAAKALAVNLIGLYNVNNSGNGLLNGPYYAWESAALWTTLIQYYANTGDATYNSDVSSALCAQAGGSGDFTSSNSPGNDDQLWWGLAAMTAAEYNLPACSSGPSWSQLASNVYNEVAARWNNSSCGGGLHWCVT
jgi:mannan endo-1,6-alpha-mannosidase